MSPPQSLERHRHAFLARVLSLPSTVARPPRNKSDKTAHRQRGNIVLRFEAVAPWQQSEQQSHQARIADEARSGKQPQRIEPRPVRNSGGRGGDRDRDRKSVVEGKGRGVGGG